MVKLMKDKTLTRVYLSEHQLAIFGQKKTGKAYAFPVFLYFRQRFAPPQPIISGGKPAHSQFQVLGSGN